MVEHKKPYNGWKNWETWNIMLWVNNDEKTYRIIGTFVRNSLRRKDLRTLSSNAQSMRTAIEYVYPNGTPDMEKEELNLVDWLSVTEALLNDFQNDL